MLMTTTQASASTTQTNLCNRRDNHLDLLRVIFRLGLLQCHRLEIVHRAHGLTHRTLVRGQGLEKALTLSGSTLMTKEAVRVSGPVELVVRETQREERKVHETGLGQARV